MSLGPLLKFCLVNVKQNVHKMFLRTVPPYSHQADVWVAMLEQLGWYRVIFVYSADEEGRAILSRFQTLAEPKEIKVRVQFGHKCLRCYDREHS